MAKLKEDQQNALSSLDNVVASVANRLTGKKWKVVEPATGTVDSQDPLFVQVGR